MQRVHKHKQALPKDKQRKQKKNSLQEHMNTGKK